MSLFFYLFSFAIDLFHWNFVAADITAQQCLSTINMVFSDEDKILINTHKHTQHTVTCVEELKSVHTKCNLFAFSSICAEYLQKI